MTRKPLFGTFKIIAYPVLCKVLLIIFAVFLSVKIAYSKRKDPIRHQILTTYFISSGTHYPTSGDIISKYSLLQKIASDSIPANQWRKPRHRVTLKTSRYKSKTRTYYSAKGNTPVRLSKHRSGLKTKHALPDSSELLAKDTLITERINLLWNLAGKGANNNTPDTSGKTFLQYINKYYHVDSLNAIATLFKAATTGGHVAVTAEKQQNAGAFSGFAQQTKRRDNDTGAFWKGTIDIDSARFNITSLGTIYTTDSQKVLLEYPAMLLNNFMVHDAAGNTLVANGAIGSALADSDQLNVHINTKNFTLLNVQKAIANQVYGVALADADVSLRGSISNPVVEGSILLRDSTDITIILPQVNINKQAEEAMVSFVDKDTFALTQTPPAPVSIVKSLSTPPLHYNFNIKTSRHAALTFIIDPSAGDELKLYGDAALKAGIDSAGGLALKGIYKIDSGFYTLNYQFLERRFNVLPGSTLTFNGAPADAGINITAAYIINTSAQNLLGNEVGEVDPRIESTFKQDIPFKVVMTLKGLIIRPQISFTIELPGRDVQMTSQLRIAIQNKLKQLKESAAATNKQVFSLLLYNRFVGEQSTDFFKGSGSGDGGRFDDLAHESVSKFLSSALDNIAADIFKTLDVDRDPDNYRDYGTGDVQQKEEIKIGATKSFINDRISINVGKYYGIDGQDASAKAAQQKGLGFLPDVTLNYKFTKDGKYRYRSYKKTPYEVTMDGYVSESGVSFIVILDYNKFSDLLNRKSKKITVNQ